MTIYIHHFIAGIKKHALVKALETYGNNNDIPVKIIRECPPIIKSNDILIIWNRHLDQDMWACRFENVKAKVIVFENPYLKPADTVDEWFSVGLGYHNDPKYAIECQDNGQRFDSFNRPILPWKKDGKHILICSQSKSFDAPGIGMTHIKQPEGWDSKIIKTFENDDYIFRPHPKIKGLYPAKNVSKNPNLIDDLQDAKCVILHNSNTSVESLLFGIPVLFTGLTLFAKNCCKKGLNINKLSYPENRKIVFDKLVWNCYSIKEIENGFLFKVLGV